MFSLWVQPVGMPFKWHSSVYRGHTSVVVKSKWFVITNNWSLWSWRCTVGFASRIWSFTSHVAWPQCDWIVIGRVWWSNASRYFPILLFSEVCLSHVSISQNVKYENEQALENKQSAETNLELGRIINKCKGHLETLLYNRNHKLWPDLRHFDGQNFRRTLFL